MGATFWKNIYTKLLTSGGIEFQDGRIKTQGSGSPEGTVAATVGSEYTDTSNGLLYLKLSGSGNTGWSVVAAGEILQVVSTTKTDTFSTSSTSFVDITGLQAEITPKSASSKILIIATVSGQHNTASNGFRIVRDSTPIGIGDAASARTQATASSLYVGDSGAMAMGLPLLFQDAPASTSELIYKIQVNVSAGTVYINRNSSDGDASSNYRTTSTITVMEIGA